MAEQIAQFRFEGFKILESNIIISEDKIKATELNTNFEQTIGEEIEECKYKHTLVAKIEDDDKTIQIMVKAVGYFNFDQSLPIEKRNVFYRINAPAILFPYVRAYISSLTALSGISPIILPTLNLAIRPQDGK